MLILHTFNLRNVVDCCNFLNYKTNKIVTNKANLQIRKVHKLNNIYQSIIINITIFGNILTYFISTYTRN